jgi:hypothetical protein
LIAEYVGFGTDETSDSDPFGSGSIRDASAHEGARPPVERHIWSMCLTLIDHF